MQPTRLNIATTATRTEHETYRLDWDDGRSSYILIISTYPDQNPEWLSERSVVTAWTANADGTPLEPLLTVTGLPHPKAVLEQILDDAVQVCAIAEVAA